MAGGLGRLEHDAEMASTDFDMHERWLTCGRFQSRTQLVSDLCVGPTLFVSDPAQPDQPDGAR